jgi:hypothetical protein
LKLNAAAYSSIEAASLLPSTRAVPSGPNLTQRESAAQLVGEVMHVGLRHGVFEVDRETFQATR